MRFDPFRWDEVKPNEKIPAEKGVLRVRCSAPSPLYIEASGYEALAGYGADFEVSLSEAVIWRVDGAKGVRVFWCPPLKTTFEPKGEVFTNVDRMPMESGQVAEVTRALRMFELERRTALREIREERAALDAARASAPTVEPVEPVAVQDDPADAGDANEPV